MADDTPEPNTTEPSKMPSEDEPFDTLASLTWLERRLGPFASQHTGSVIALGTFLLVALKVLGVALFNVNVALGLLGGTDPGRVLLGLFMTLVPVVAATAFVAMLGLTGLAYGVRRMRAGFLVPLYIAVIVVLASAPLGLVGYMALMGLILAGMFFYFGRQESDPMDPEEARVRVAALEAYIGDETSSRYRDTLAATRLTALVIPVVFVIGTLYGSEPWVPSEVVTIGTVPEVGYVVGDDGRWFTLLEARTRVLKIVPSSSVTARQPCGTSEPLGKTLFELLEPSLGLPPCPR